MLDLKPTYVLGRGILRVAHVMHNRLRASVVVGVDDPSSLATSCESLQYGIGLLQRKQLHRQAKILLELRLLREWCCQLWQAFAMPSCMV